MRRARYKKNEIPTDKRTREDILVHKYINNYMENVRKDLLVELFVTRSRVTLSK